MYFSTEYTKNTKTLLSHILVLTIGIIVFFASCSTIHAAAISWDGGGGNGSWCTATNWSGDTIPTDADDVTINTAITVTTSACAAGEVDFSSLTIGGSAATVFRPDKNFGTAGSITIASSGVLEQYTTTQLTITGDLVINSGGILRHGSNTTTHIYSVNLSANNITISSGGSVNVDSRGYNTNTGPGAGTSGGGGGHSGNGGNGTSPGGTGYCDINDPSTIGSGGHAGVAVNKGGGLIKLSASGTLTISGTITADGVSGSSGGSGGAGGAIGLTADTILGTPQSFTATGGNADSGGTRGGGGGGCVNLTYTTSTSISASTVNANGGTGTNRGAGGLIYIKDSDSGNGNLYVKNGGSGSALTPQLSDTFTADSITVTSYGIYSIGTGKELTLEGVSPFLGDVNSKIDIQGTLNAANATSITGGIVSINGGTFNNNSALATIGSTGGLTLVTGGSISTTMPNLTSSGLLNFYVDTDPKITNLTITTGTVTLTNFTIASDPLPLVNVTMNGGTLNHATNTTSQTHIINITATSFALNSSASINVDGRGYNKDTGPGAGASGSGGGHGGNGGASSVAGGTAYCNINSPATIGSGGGSGTSSKGGGLIKIDVENTLTINGTLTADGNNGASGGGGGAGGAIYLIADIIAGSPTSFTATGGNADSGGTRGGGGGGCIKIEYGTSTTIDGIGDVNLAGGSGTNLGSIGLFLAEQTNAAPTISTGLASIGQATDGTGYYTVTFSADDADGNPVSIQVEGGNSSFGDFQIVSVSTGTLDNDAATYQITDLDTSGGPVDVTMILDTKNSLDDVRTSTFQLRVTPYDGTSTGTTSTLTDLFLDNEDPVIDSPGLLSISVDTGGIGVANIGDTMDFTGGTVSNVEDVNNWAIFAPTLVDDPYMLAGGGPYIVTAGSLDNPTQTFTVRVTDDYGNYSETDSNAINVDNEAPTITDPGVVTITTDNGVADIAGIGDGITLTEVTVLEDDDDEITIDYGIVGGLDEVQMGVEDFISAGEIDGDTSFIIHVRDNAGNEVTVASAAISIDNEAPDISENGTLTVTTDGNSDGTAAIGDKITQSIGSESTGDDVSWTIDLTNLTGEASLDALTESLAITEGDIDATNNTFTITVTDDAGNTDTILSDELSIDNISPTAANGGTITVTTNITGNNSIASIGDLVTYTEGTLNEADDVTWSIDLTDLTGQASIVAGVESTAVLAGAIDDPNYTFDITLTDDAGNTGATTSGTLSIDNQAPSITDPGAVSITIDNNSDGIASIGDTLTLTGLTTLIDDDDIITIDYDTIGGVAEVLMGNQDFVTAGISNGNFAFNIDVMDNAGNITSTNSNEITVYNIEHEIEFANASSNGSESVTAVNIEITLDAASGINTTINYDITGGTATENTDFTLAGSSSTISSGNQTINLALTIINDDDVELDETIIITLSDPNGADLGANSSFTYTITNDDEDEEPEPNPEPQQNRSRYQSTGSYINKPTNTIDFNRIRESQTRKVELTPLTQEDFNLNPFTDATDHWGLENILTLYKAGIVNGTTSTTAEPNRNINRAELLKVALGISGIETDPSLQSSTWYDPYLSKGSELQIMTQGEPDREITRAEALKVLLTSFAIDTSNTDITVNTFSDVTYTDWYISYTTFAHINDIVEGYEDNTFRGNQPITRAEAFTIAKRIYEFVQK